MFIFILLVVNDDIIQTQDECVKADGCKHVHRCARSIDYGPWLKGKDGVKPKQRPDAGAILYEEFCAMLGPHRVELAGKMVGPNHMIMQLVGWLRCKPHSFDPRA